MSHHHFPISGRSTAAEQYQAMLAERAAARLADLEELRRRDARLKVINSRIEPDDEDPGRNAQQHAGEEPEPEPDEDDDQPKGGFGKHFA